MSRSRETAIREASELVERMGKGWTFRIWENMGWHWKLVDDTTCWSICKTTLRDDVSYTAYLGTPNSIGGYYTGSGKTPEAAIRDAQKTARADIERMKPMFDAMENIVLKGHKRG